VSPKARCSRFFSHKWAGGITEVGRFVSEEYDPESERFWRFCGVKRLSL
jgi:hypothetical protein